MENLTDQDRQRESPEALIDRLVLRARTQKRSLRPGELQIAFSEAQIATEEAAVIVRRRIDALLCRLQPQCAPAVARVALRTIEGLRKIGFSPVLAAWAESRLLRSGFVPEVSRQAENAYFSRPGMNGGADAHLLYTLQDIRAWAEERVARGRRRAL